MKLFISSTAAEELQEALTAGIKFLQTNRGKLRRKEIIGELHIYLIRKPRRSPIIILSKGFKKMILTLAQAKFLAEQLKLGAAKIQELKKLVTL